uniref:ELMO domain-containing protein n=1 Tax=Timema genevievae TaxID=629358 RepID=A0A7R9K4F5_TIMGE|nr:unnamed protein product [Timema genevievae]
MPLNQEHNIFYETSVNRKKYSRESALSRNRKNVDTDDISLCRRDKRGYKKGPVRTVIGAVMVPTTPSLSNALVVLSNALVVLSPTAEDGEIEVRISVGLASARQEWDSVATVEPTFKESVDPRRSTPHISVHQTLMYFQGLDLSQEMSNTRTSVERRGLCTLFSCLLGPPNLHEQLLAERDLVFAIAQWVASSDVEGSKIVDSSLMQSAQSHVYLSEVRMSGHTECSQSDCVVLLQDSDIVTGLSNIVTGLRGIVTGGKLDLEDCVHYRMLQTVYQRLTGTRLDCTCYGSHWQQIGFQVSLSWDRRDEAHCGGRLIYESNSPSSAIQPIARLTSYTIQQPNCNTPTTPSVDTWSKATLFNRLDCRRQGDWGSILVGCTEGNDPGTDLRGVGMFGLLQLLYLASSPHLMPLARDIYRVSLDEQQNFPLAVLSLNMTRMALQTLRQGLLNRECNERQMVVEVLNEFYAAIFCHTLHIWTSQHKTIRDSGYVLKDVEWFCRSNVRAVFRNFHAQLNSYNAHSLKNHDSTLCLQGSFHDLLTQAKTEVFI